MKTPRWLKVAEGEIGVKETSGPLAHTGRILEYHQATTLKAKADEVPWCSAFVCWAMEQAGIKSTRSAAARSWLKWGEPLEIMEPRLGCVVVFRRGRHPWQGHVGFYVGEDGPYVRCLGGNQQNRVKVSKYHRSRVLGYRWPV